MIAFTGSRRCEKPSEVQVYGGSALVTFYWQVRLRGKKLNQKIRGRATHV